MRTNLDELGCSEEITSFVLPLGMTITMNNSIMQYGGDVRRNECRHPDVTPATLAYHGGPDDTQPRGRAGHSGRRNDDDLRRQRPAWGYDRACLVACVIIASTPVVRCRSR